MNAPATVQYPFATTQSRPVPQVQVVNSATSLPVAQPFVATAANPFPFNTSSGRKSPTLYVENGKLAVPTNVRTARMYPMPTIPSRFEPSFGRWGHYQLPDVQGEKSEAFYPRVTTISKTLDDTTHLEKWSAAKALEGLARFPHLLNMVDVDSAASGDRSTREFLENLFEVAKEAAGSKDASEFGNAVHAWTEAVDLGLCDVSAVPLELRAHVAAYVAATRRAGISPVAAYVERIVHNSVTGAAGRIDRIAMLPDGSLVILDVKTTSNLSHGWLGIGVQLAQYATGWGLLAEDGQAWEAMPPNLRTDIALVAHVPSTPDPKAGGVFCDLVVVDLKTGIEWMKVSRTVREIRSGKRHINLGTMLRAMSTDAPAPLSADMSPLIPALVAPPAPTVPTPAVTAVPAVPAPQDGVVSIHAPSTAPDVSASLDDRVFRRIQDALSDRDLASVFTEFKDDWKPEFTEWGKVRMRQMGAPGTATSIEDKVRAAIASTSTTVDMIAVYTEFEADWKPEFTEWGMSHLGVNPN